MVGMTAVQTKWLILESLATAVSHCGVYKNPLDVMATTGNVALALMGNEIRILHFAYHWLVDHRTLVNNNNNAFIFPT